LYGGAIILQGVTNKEDYLLSAMSAKVAGPAHHKLTQQQQQQQQQQATDPESGLVSSLVKSVSRRHWLSGCALPPACWHWASASAAA